MDEKHSKSPSCLFGVTQMHVKMLQPNVVMLTPCPPDIQCKIQGQEHASATRCTNFPHSGYCEHYFVRIAALSHI